MTRSMRILKSLLILLFLGCASLSAESPYLEQIDQIRETPQSLLFGINMVANPHILYRPKGYMEDVYTTLDRIGGTMVRLCASPRDDERVRGKRDLSELVEDVDTVLRHGMEPMMLICNTPTWALPVEQIPGYEEVRDWPEKKRTEWLGKFTHQYPYRTDLFPEFADYCRDVAKRLKGKVRLYQLWNEPNGCSWHFHDGYNHADEYVPFLAVAYEAIKEVDPDALLLLGSLDDKDGWGHIFLNMYYDIRDKDYGGRSLCDGITVHPYDEDIEHKKWKLKRLRDIMVKNGDADLPVFITEYGWRTGDAGDDKKQKWLAETLEMYQDEDLDFLKGAIHLCLSDFEGEPGFGLTDENLRPRESFNMFQGTPRFGASPPHSIDWRLKPHRGGFFEITYKTVLPTKCVLQYWKQDEGSGPGKHWKEGHDTSFATEHDSFIDELEPGATYAFRILSITEGGKHYWTPEYSIRVPDNDVYNGDFNHGFFAGIAEGWRIEGNGLCTDAAVFPGCEMEPGEHAQVIFAVPERKIGLQSTAYTWVRTEESKRYRVSLTAANLSHQSDAAIRARIGVDLIGRTDFGEDGPVWSSWKQLTGNWETLEMTVSSPVTLPTLFVQVELTEGGGAGRPAVAFDKVRIAELEP
jgi:hypothetical protein